MVVEVLDPIETHGISSPAILGGCDMPVGWEVALGVQLARWYCAAKMMNGGMAQARALTPWMTVAHSRLPGWASFALVRPSEVVTTMPAKMMPIINPVSSKL
jgi:hypothetical protein